MPPCPEQDAHPLHHHGHAHSHHPRPWQFYTNKSALTVRALGPRGLELAFALPWRPEPAVRLTHEVGARAARVRAWTAA